MCFLVTHVFDYFRQSPSLSFSIYPRLLYSPCGCVRLRYIEGICHKIVTKLSRDPNRFHICTDRISELSVIFTLSVSMFFGVQSSIHRIFPGGLSMGLILASCSSSPPTAIITNIFHSGGYLINERYALSVS